MTSDLTRCNCCGLGCGDGCDACNGAFFPSSVSVSFTPHFLGAWTADPLFTGAANCNGSGHTEPDCPEVIITLGDYPEWFTGSQATLTFTSSGDSPCKREYTCADVDIEEPTGIPDWTDNPIGLPATASKWCEIETAMDCFGPGTSFDHWSGRLILEADRCDDTGTGGTATNTLLAFLVIEAVTDTGGSHDVLTRRFIITSSETGCSCFLPDYGSGSWASHCPGNDCWPGLPLIYAQALKTDWGGEFGKGSETVTWEADSGDCCENRSVDLYYIAGYSAGQTDPPAGCGNMADSVTCPGYDDIYRLFQLSWPLVAPPFTGRTVHFAKEYAGNTGLDCFHSCIITGKYGFSFSTHPALTDLSISWP